MEMQKPHKFRPFPRNAKHKKSHIRAPVRSPTHLRKTQALEHLPNTKLIEVPPTVRRYHKNDYLSHGIDREQTNRASGGFVGSMFVG